VQRRRLRRVSRHSFSEMAEFLNVSHFRSF
jgi:hypothetical protein